MSGTRLATAAATFALAAGVCAQEAGTSGALVDPADAAGALSCSDAAGFAARIADDQVECVLTMARPIRDGMFTCVELFIDCDDKAETGLQGKELRIRAAVGSRFAPNALPAEPGAGPLDHLRQSMTVLERNEVGAWRWIHSPRVLARPAVAERELRFAFPLALVKERGDRYGSAFAIDVVVRTSCSDQPIERQHVCADQGLPIRVDGQDDDWSGAATQDPGDELHEQARAMDVTSLRVEHDAERLYACVALAQAGFTDPGSTGDVRLTRRLTFHVEPSFPRYQAVATIVLLGGDARPSGVAGKAAWQAQARGPLVELSLQRSPGQSGYRVVVWSDHECEDWFDAPLRLDARKR